MRYNDIIPQKAAQSPNLATQINVIILEEMQDQPTIQRKVDSANQ